MSAIESLTREFRGLLEYYLQKSPLRSDEAITPSQRTLDLLEENLLSAGTEPHDGAIREYFEAGVYLLSVAVPQFHRKKVRAKSNFLIDAFPIVVDWDELSIRPDLADSDPSLPPRIAMINHYWRLCLREKQTGKERTADLQPTPKENAALAEPTVQSIVRAADNESSPKVVGAKSAQRTQSNPAKGDCRKLLESKLKEDPEWEPTKKRLQNFILINPAFKNREGTIRRTFYRIKARQGKI